jgi:hypothetical protein
VTAIATSDQQRDESVVDRLGAFYAQHPTLVNTLGVAAFSAVTTQAMGARVRKRTDRLQPLHVALN